MTKSNGWKGVWVFVVLVCALLGFAVDQVRAWPVPDTGQTTSYAVGDDGYYNINPPSYTVNGDGTVTDNVTSLMWQQQDDGQIRNWADAKGYCEDLTLAGHEDWRLPTVHELASLEYHGVTSPSIDSTVFPGTQLSWYWSATVGGVSVSNVWGVNFTYFGEVLDIGEAENNYVRCVRSGPVSWPIGPLSINNSATITDAGTGLSWQRQDDDQGRTWEQALAYCEGLTLDGFDDWRLPTAHELHSLVDYGKDHAAIDETAFPGTLSAFYWSSTVRSDYTYHAFYVDFNFGLVSSINLAANIFVRCVRSGPVNGAVGHLSIASPPQGSTLSYGTVLITWTDPQDPGGQVAIYLSRDGGKAWETITGSTENDGSYDWTVNGAESVNCVLKVEPITAPTKVGFQGLFSILKNATVTTTTTEAPTSTTTTTTLPVSVNVTLPVSTGWNLLSSVVGIQVSSVFGDDQKYISTWKWTDDGNGGKTWAVFLPGGDGGVTYANSKGFIPLTTIASGEGFWVNGKTDEQVQVNGTPAYGELSFSTGWNLVGVKGTNAMAVADLGEVTSAWKWTTVNGNKTWAVNLPGENDKGASYATFKGFGQFTTIEPGEGFWVNKQ